MIMAGGLGGSRSSGRGVLPTRVFTSERHLGA